MSNTFLIVGFGSIGRRHLSCLRKLCPNAEIIIWHQHNQSSDIPQGADAVVFCLEDALARHPLAAIISNPAPLHLDVAISLAEDGIHLLVEKPLSTSLQGVDKLIAICKERGLILMVAYVLRFNESLRFFKETVDDRLIGRMLSVRVEIGQYLPDWRPDVDYRQTVSAREELGGGALLELSHELDYLGWIFGDVCSVQGVIENTGLLDIDVDDLVELILDLCDDQGGKIIATVHLDMLQRKAKRFCRVIGENGLLEWNALSGSVRQYHTKDRCWRTLFESLPSSENSMYISQLKSFLECVRDGSIPFVTGQDGRGVLKIVQAARDAASQQITVAIGNE